MRLSTQGPDQLGRLRHALRVSSNDYDRHQYAHMIAAVGSAEAYELLVSEVAQQTRAKEACAAALRQVGPDIIPLVLLALQNDRDNSYLPSALPVPFDDHVADALLAVCKRTTNEWVVLVITERLAKAAPSAVADLGEVVLKRRSSLLTAAMHCGLASAKENPESLDRYLAESASIREQDLALALPEVRQLPAAKQLLQRRIADGRVGDRAHALRLVVEDRAADFADAVLEAWVSDRSPTVQYAALQAIRAIGPDLGSALHARIERSAQALADAIETLVAQREGSDDQVRAQVSTADAAVQELGRLWSAALLVDADTTDMAMAVVSAYRRAGPQAVGVAMQRAEPLCSELLHLGDELIRRLVGVYRHLWQNGEASVRQYALETAGLPAVAFSETPVDLPHSPKQKLDWDGFFGELSRCCEEAVWGWLYLNWGFLEGHQAAAHPLAGLSWIRQRIARLITSCEIEGFEMLPALLSALQQSRHAENETRERVESELGCLGLAAIQQQFDERPLVLLSLEKQLLAGFVHSHQQQRGEIPDDIRLAAPILAEQTFQTAILNILAVHLAPEATSTLIDCIDSRSELVVECAQNLLYHLGQAAFPALEKAFKRRDSGPQRAHLLEVCRCIDAAASVGLARKYLRKDDDLLTAVFLRVLEVAGDATDMPVIKLALERDDELVRVTALYALTSLAADEVVDEFVCALSHPSATVRYVALRGLQQCSKQVQDTTAELLSESDDVFKQVYGQALFDTDASRALCPHFQGEPIEVAGSFIMGARCATLSDLPWQWGLPDLFAQDQEFDWAGVWPLIAHDQQLARDWIEYSLERDLPASMLGRLATIARTGETDVEAEQAHELMLVLIKDSLAPIVQAAAHYYGCLPERVHQAAAEAFCQALADSSHDTRSEA